MRRSILLGLVLAQCGWLSALFARPVVAANPPTKQTVMVPMRDGIHLATDLYLPAGAGPWPVALCRTPYDKNPVTNDPPPLAQFAQNGVVAVVQDTRGRHASEG